MNRRETERILSAIRSAQQARQAVALATIVRVHGSAYRREGARILVRHDGSYECLLSGGCLEPTVADAAARVIATGRPIVAQYDLAEDSIWSVGIGCSGAVDILIERLGDDELTAEWLAILERGEPGVLVRSLVDVDRQLLIHEHGVLGSLGDPALDAAATMHARERLRLSSPESVAEIVHGHELFFEVSAPAPQLVIFGAGSDTEPLARYAWEVGFAVMVIDVREAFLTTDRFPHATLVSSHYSDFAEALRLSERSFVVIMNHHLERDRESLRFALGSPAHYIGVLGPRSRFEKILRALNRDGVAADADTLGRVRNPIGLALGAETPEEVAVSIVGEVLALARGFDGGFLVGRATSLHRPRARARAAAADGHR